MTETAEEYVQRVITENKEFYKTPEKMIDEMVILLENLKTRSLPAEEKWEFVVAVSEAWHVVAWVHGDTRAKRLVNTIASFVKGNITMTKTDKKVDITKYEDFIEAGFKECSECGWAFDPAEFDRHNCDEMKIPAHNHILAGDPICPKDCPYKKWVKENNKKLPERS